MPSRTEIVDTFQLTAGTYKYLAAGYVENAAYSVSFYIYNLDTLKYIVNVGSGSKGMFSTTSTFKLTDTTNVKVRSYNYNGILGTSIIKIS